jgi:hypothetical protein
MRFWYEGGATAGLDSATTIETHCDGFIYGDKGHLHLHPRFHEADSLSMRIHDGEDLHFATPRTGNGYFHEILEVNECLRNGKTESDKLPLDYSILLMETLDWIRREIGLKYPGEA